MSIATKERRFAVPQKNFTGTVQEFNEHYIKEKGIAEQTLITVVFNREELPTSTATQVEQLSSLNILEKGIKEGLDDLNAGKVERATPDFFEQIKKEGRARGGL